MKKAELLEKIEGKALKNQIGNRGGYVPIGVKLGDLCEMLENKEIIIPDFQRLGNQWTERERAELVNTILCGRPMSSIILGRYNDNLYLIDGQQRITSSVLMLNLLKENGFKASQINLVKNYSISCDVPAFEHYDEMKIYFNKVNARSGLSKIQKLKAGKNVSMDFLETFNSLCNLIVEAGEMNEGYLNLVKLMYAKKSTIEATGLEANVITRASTNAEGKTTVKKTSKLKGCDNFAIWKYGKIEEFATIMLLIDNSEEKGAYTTSIDKAFNSLLKMENIDISNTLEKFITTIIPRCFSDGSKDDKSLFKKLTFIYAMYDYIRHADEEIGIDEVSMFLNQFLNKQHTTDDSLSLYNVLSADYEAGTSNNSVTFNNRYNHIASVFDKVKNHVFDNLPEILSDADIKAMESAMVIEE